eukprot:6125586-Prymnesium_polylepis.1
MLSKLTGRSTAGGASARNRRSVRNRFADLAAFDGKRCIFGSGSRKVARVRKSSPQSPPSRYVDTVADARRRSR